VQRTFVMLKPDALNRGLVGKAIARFEDKGLKIVGMKMLQLDVTKAEGFYAVHKDKPFFESLVKFMVSGPCVVATLEGENAINKWRETMGVTDPEKAAEGTIRRDFGTSIERNAVHGSDAPDTAEFEVKFFFEPGELVEYEWV